MDAAASERAALFGVSEGGPMCALFAATYPERIWALALFASFPRAMWAPDHPFGDTAEEARQELEELGRRAGDPTYFHDLAGRMAPSASSAAPAS